jgi:cytochrome b561
MQKNVRYSPAARFFHWVVGCLILVMLVIGWIWPAMAPGSTRQFVSDVHKMLGCVVLLLVAFRIGVRLMRRPPSSDRLPRWQRATAAAVHGSLYVLMLLMPVSGLAVLNWRRGVSFFGLRLPQWDPQIVGSLLENPAGSFKMVHYLSAYLISTLVIVHILAALWHQFVRKDNLLLRMLPARKRSGRSDGTN